MYYLLYSLLWRFIDQPLPLILIAAVLFLLIDRRYLGLLPDISRPFRRHRHLARLNNTIRTNPADAHTALELGALYLERGQAVRALPFLLKARERDAESARVHLLLGICHRRLGRALEARAALERSIELNPRIGYGEPYYHLLALGIEAGDLDPDNVSRLKERILALGSPEIFYRSGRALLAGGDKSGARKMFEEAVANYQASPRGFRRAHRRWAAGSRICLMFC